MNLSASTQERFQKSVQLYCAFSCWHVEDVPLRDVDRRCSGGACSCTAHVHCDMFNNSDPVLAVRYPGGACSCTAHVDGGMFNNFDRHLAVRYPGGACSCTAHVHFATLNNFVRDVAVRYPGRSVQLYCSRSWCHV